MLKLSTFLFIFITLVSCGSNPEEELVREEFLINCWTHSMEEDLDGRFQIYRTCQSMTFPESRFRMVFDLKSDGTCEYLELSPVDAHRMVKGTWTFESGTQRLMLFAEKGDPAFMMRVERLEANLAELRSI